MPSITDHIDRLTRSMETIRASASSIAKHNQSGPFTQSVLATPLGDLIRDIDPSEIGLFTLVPPPRQPSVNTQSLTAPEITRVEVVSATPLRKYSTQRRDAIVQNKEPEPEVFAEAALKYIDRYSGVRPLPQVRSQVVAMLEHLHQLREEIYSLANSLKNMEASERMSDSQSPKSLVAKEEKKIQELQARISHLRKRKVALQNSRSVLVAPVEDRTANSPGPNAAVSDPQEDSFWTTPGGRRTLQFKNELLVYEDVDLRNVTSSFPSPAPFDPRSAPIDSPLQQEEGPTDDTIPEDLSNLEDTFDRTSEAHDSNFETIGQAGNQTTKVKGHTNQPLPLSGPPPTSEPSTPVVSREQVTSSFTMENHTHSAKKIRITNDMERIVSKIWATVGDLMMPGNSSGSGGSRPLRAKETIAHLHTLAAQDPLPVSPTASTISIATVATTQPPTSQQILTAHLLISLLEAAPQYALPLATVKEILSAKGDRGLVIGSGASIRVLYGCVAKRLVRIDRGGGEQIVRFDI
ncbi:hypothetical protein F5148DRAFT_1173011 [Russula earlei]|uniref:Uncharacterized protein n=1 Tax=Russula earlei TaxID=71964 RepID=A0ACC0UJC3_9AGAM|nr:hypothetical protein F5148DRAFT_1173011 [Russula earlei]